MLFVEKLRDIVKFDDFGEAADRGGCGENETNTGNRKNNLEKTFMLKIAIVGATGIVGQQAIVSLLGHPWFEILNWSPQAFRPQRNISTHCATPTAPSAGGVRKNCRNTSPTYGRGGSGQADPASVDIISRPWTRGPAKELEPKYAKTTPVISTASAFRYEADTPILVGGVNMDHAALLDVQRKNRGWKGFISPKSNCTIAGLVVSLKPILAKPRNGMKQTGRLINNWNQLRPSRRSTPPRIRPSVFWPGCST